MATTDREFQVTLASGDAECLGFGSGNINGNTDANSPNGLDPFLVANPTWMFVDMDEGNGAIDFGFSYTGDETLMGTFTLTPEDGFKYALGLKSGNGQLDPDWAVFGLPIGTTTGEWKIVTGSQSLSHANLYKMAVNGMTPIPLPASLPLLFAGLAGLGLISWRRKAA